MQPVKASKRLLCIVENPHELENFLPIKECIERHGQGLLGVEFATLDSYLFQGVGEALARLATPYRSLPIARSLEKPLPLYGFWARNLVKFCSRKQIVQLASQYDGILCGIDADLARIALFAARDRRKPTFQVLNALTLVPPKRGWHLGSVIKNSLKWLLGTLVPESEYLKPTRGYGTSGCDRVFVVGEHIKQELIKRGVDEKTIVVSGTPRFAHLFSHKRSEHVKARNQTDDFNLLYVTGSFAWHGDWVNHERQTKQLHHLVAMLEELPPRVRLFVKVHPREQESSYEWVYSCGERIILLSREANIYDAIKMSDVVIGMWSTVLVEALAFFKPSIALNFPVSKSFIEYTAASGSIATVTSVDELKNLILMISTNENAYIDLLEKEVPVFSEYVATCTPNSAQIIAEEILRIMRH
jgi:hypothetical protein